MSIVNNLSNNAHWALRIALASVFIFHGVTKYPVLQPMAEMLGMSVPIIFILATLETFAGVLVIWGGFSKEIFTRIGAAIIIPIMSGAIMKSHWGQWNFVPSESHPMGGMEFQVTLILISIFLLIKGNNLFANTSKG